MNFALAPSIETQKVLCIRGADSFIIREPGNGEIYNKLPSPARSFGLPRVSQRTTLPLTFIKPTCLEGMLSKILLVSMSPPFPNLEKRMDPPS